MIGHGMTDKERLVRFSLLGQDFAFYTGASEAEMQKILSLVRQLTEEGSGATKGTIPAGKAAIMACLNIASRYIKLKQDFDDYKAENEVRVSSLIQQIDACLLPKKRS
jgi:cell division protein ZapA